ncbi:MAG: radical SAM protein [Chitinophagales bacterium]|nr:radical SAM protein [Chitinophagales bacterium]
MDNIQKSNQRILFLNPPGKKLYMRDYYCSKASKANYLPQPIDLLMQTGFFAEKGYTLKVIDAIIEKLSVSDCIKQVTAFSPHLIITQCGAVSFEEDNAFMEALKNELPQTPILSSGDLFLDNPAYFLEKHKWLSGIITDFFSDASLHFFENNGAASDGLVTRSTASNYIPAKRKTQKVKLPRPRHELFKNELYIVPFANCGPMATVLTNFACPYPCTFCIMSTLPFKTRSLEEVKEELLFLKKSGIRYIYFSDQTFYVNTEMTEALLDFIIAEKLNFSIMCYSRVDVMNEAKMRKLKKAGCNILMFGVEWADDAYSKKYKKNYNTEQVKAAFKTAQQVGIKTMGTFLIGVPGQNAQSILNTVQFAIDLKADYAAFNVAAPRSNTSFRKEALESGLITTDDILMDQSGSFVAMGTGLLSSAEVMSLKKKAYLKFYFRPSYLFKRAIGITTFYEFKNHIKDGWYVLLNQV